MNAFTRRCHPAALANVALMLQEMLGGRLARHRTGRHPAVHLGRKPDSGAPADFIATSPTYRLFSANGTVDCDATRADVRG